MSCNTCGHTLEIITRGDGRAVYHCPRCGTLRMVDGERHTDYVPRLVDRCRSFEDTLGPRWAGLWETLGIHEAIHS